MCWNHRNSKQDFTYVNHDLGHCSCVDHFILSMALYESIHACSINISPLNPSDHCVVKLTLGYDVYAGTTCNVQFTKGKLAWHKAKDLDQALTLGLWMQWPGGPVDLKTYWPPQKLTGPPKN